MANRLNKNEDTISWDTRWFKGLDEKEIEERKKHLLANKKTLDIVRDIVYNMGIGAGRVTEKDYDCPSWSHKQAHTNGLKEAFQRIEKLVSL